MDEKQIIQQILDLKENEVEQFIEQRLDELENTAIEDRDEISLISYILRRNKGEKENTEVVGYIPSKTKISKMQFDIASFKVDDKSFYKTIIDYVKKVDNNRIKQGDKINHNYIMSAIQCTIIDYFGMRGNENRRNVLYNSKDDIIELLDYLNVIFFEKCKENINYSKAVSIVEKVKKKINANNNFDMSIDYMLIHIWEEFNG